MLAGSCSIVLTCIIDSSQNITHRTRASSRRKKENNPEKENIKNPKEIHSKSLVHQKKERPTQSKKLNKTVIQKGIEIQVGKVGGIVK